MRRFVRFLVGIFLIVVALVVVANYASYNTIYECSGLVTDQNKSSGQSMLFAKIKQYRWWAFWHALDGLLRLEIPGGRIPTVSDEALDTGWFKTGSNSSWPARFPGITFGSQDSSKKREDLFGIKRVDTGFVSLA